MDFSDSDDDILPGMNTFNAMFVQVQQKAKEKTPPVPSSKCSSNKSNKKKKSDEKKKEKLASAEKPTARQAGSSSSRSNGKVELSDASKNLLQELDEISDIPIIIPHLSPSSSKKMKSETIVPEVVQIGRSRRACTARSAPILPPRRTQKNSSRRTTGRGRGRGRRAPAAEVIDVSDSEDVPVMEESFNLADLMEPEVQQEVDELCSFRIRWKQELMRFKIHKNSKMSDVRNEISNRVGVRADNIVILDDETTEEVPDSRLVETIPFGKVFECFERELMNGTAASANLKNLGPDQVIIKLQGRGGYRERYTTVIRKTTHVNQLIADFIERFGYQGRKFKLVLDGEAVDLTETPDSLDLENNDMIDVVEIKSD